jgi:hypothetical protein
MFSGVMKTNISIAILAVPFIVFLISSISCLIVFNLSKIFLKHKRQANILAMMAGTGNSGYFGIPVAMMIFPAELVGVYITTVLGKVIFQNSVGIYITARGSYTVKDSFKKVFTIPVIYGFILAIILSHFSIPIAPFLQEFFDSIKGAYVVIGMMIIGLGIASMQKFSLDILFTIFAFTTRFIIWPTIAFLIYQLDQATFSILNENIAKALILASIVPLAADSVAFASIMKCHPDINGDSDENMDRFYEITDAYNTIKGNANKIYELLELEDGCDIDEVKAEFYKNMNELSFKSGSGDKKAREKLENLRKYYNYFRSVRATKSSGSW